ncbi:E3 ubiquitin-protein ligase TRIM39-like [Scyliorhinus canicula]|uniref:E3 ubiquitin-protein ligase TRIM39-like n=1 Tax=Scyliorhinus canicula TaxID=7830 RepID=UPI0018F28C5F|nr:E3 ubiquitin-protein ligase TRIM39-like [Scyliorhinus canicula]
MSSKGASGSEMGDLTQELTCPICLEVFTHPVSLECGHHFCSSCISESWQPIPGDVSCPQCRQVFTQRNVRPARTLSNIVEKFRVLKVKVTQAANGIYCQEHEEKLKMFCKEEQEAICVDCWTSEHQTHNVITLKEAAQIYKEKLETSLDLLERQMKELTENKMKEEGKMEELKVQTVLMADTIKDEFEKMHKFLNEREEAMRNQLRQEEENESKRLEGNVTAIMGEVSAIERKISEIQARLKMTEAVEMLKGIKDFITSCDVQAQLPEPLVELTMEVLGEPFQIFRVWKGMRQIIAPVPASLTLDPDTANTQLIISQDLLSVKHSNKQNDEEQDLPDAAARFNEYLYVLSTQSFTSGRHYWEVDLRNKIQWVIGVCRGSANRKGDFLVVPTEGYWVLSLFNENDYRASNLEYTRIPVEVKPWKLGVYLDYEAGQVTFYNADNMSHLYTFTDTFTEKLYPIFSPCNNLSGKNGEPLTLLTG